MPRDDEVAIPLVDLQAREPGEDANNRRRIERPYSNRLLVADRRRVQVSDSQVVDYRRRFFGRMARRMCLAPSVIGSSVSGPCFRASTWLPPRAMDANQSNGKMVVVISERRCVIFRFIRRLRRVLSALGDCDR